MAREIDITLTATAPAIWGCTYLVTTEFLPTGYPITAAMLRALPAGLILLALTPALPQGIWITRVLILGALNFSLFWWLLFVAAYTLPGGIAATIGAVQPLIVLGLSSLFLGEAIRPLAVVAGIGGMIGVGLLVLGPAAITLDSAGLVAAIGGALSMAAGTVLSRKWQPPVSTLLFTSWQLTAGGILLLPAALFLEPSLPVLTTANIAGFVWLTLIGGAVSYIFWFRGIARLGPNIVAPLVLLSPVTAVLLGMIVLAQTPDLVQALGMMLVLFSVWLNGRVNRSPTSGSPAKTDR